MNFPKVNSFHRVSIQIALLVILFPIARTQEAAEIKSKVPAWDARGVPGTGTAGALPWQGATSLQISPDGNRIVVGTIAPSDDPNVIVLDATGKIVAHHAVGQRWIESVAMLPEGTSFMAFCTHANGTANDFPTVFIRGAQQAMLAPLCDQTGFRTAAFHYGDHSNHLGMRALSCNDGIWVASGNRALWHANAQTAPTFTTNIAVGDDAVSLTAAALPNGVIALGFAVPVLEDRATLDNFYLLKPGDEKPLWARTKLRELPPVPKAEKGLYGSPTPRVGPKEELQQWDVPVVGPLSIALHASPDGSLQSVATADYRGWQRWVLSSATRRNQHIGTRMMPGRPVVSVYDARGTRLRVFAAELFAEAAWLDLRFLPDGKRLVAWPHRWTSRGLGGSPFLPADADARAVYLLDIDSGEVRTQRLPDAIADGVVLPTGEMIISCWDGGCYRFGIAEFFIGAPLPKPVSLSGPVLLAVQADGQRVIAATANGIVIGMDSALHEQWRCDLNQALPHAEKPWVAKASAVAIVPGVWNLPGGRTESDAGGQRVIEAPDGLILIEAHAGLSFEREWEAIKKAGLDPMRVKYVLATHEHGDHGPGAYLWRVATGAQFVCSEEMAYTMQHHIPLNSGYGFHPPVPTDIKIKEDSELNLAGLKVSAIRAPGHTAGSMAWGIEKDGKKLLAIGDLIMPHGPLGYAGSINFSATDVLASLKKLYQGNYDLILPGHGPILPPSNYLGEGIESGTRGDWDKKLEPKPDPVLRK